MPPSGDLFALTLIFLMVVSTLAVGAVVRLAGHSASLVMIPLAIVLVIAFPFLIVWHPADSPNSGDALLGWPLIYAYAQSDADLTDFRWGPFLIDPAVGTIVGIIYILIRRRTTLQPSPPKNR